MLATAVFRWMVACPRAKGPRPGNVMRPLCSQCHQVLGCGPLELPGGLRGEEGKQWAFGSCVELGACLGTGSRPGTPAFGNLWPIFLIPGSMGQTQTRRETSAPHAPTKGRCQAPRCRASPPREVAGGAVLDSMGHWGVPGQALGQWVCPAF